MNSVINVGLFTEVLVTLFVIMDPPGTVPVFISLTAGQTRAVRKKAAWQAVLVAFGVIVVFATFGQQILNHLGITLPALQEGKEAVTVRYGAFLQTTFDFVIVAFAIFIAVKMINRLKRKEEVAPSAPPPPSKEEVLLTEIRDLLKNK